MSIALAIVLSIVLASLSPSIALSIAFSIALSIALSSVLASLSPSIAFSPFSPPSSPSTSSPSPSIRARHRTICRSRCALSARNPSFSTTTRSYSSSSPPPITRSDNAKKHNHTTKLPSPANPPNFPAKYPKLSLWFAHRAKLFSETPVSETPVTLTYNKNSNNPCSPAVPAAIPRDRISVSLRTAGYSAKYSDTFPAIIRSITGGSMRT